jgi:hypothetical protein
MTLQVNARTWVERPGHGDAVTIWGYAPVYKVIRVASRTPLGLAAGGFFA